MQYDEIYELLNVTEDLLREQEEDDAVAVSEPKPESGTQAKPEKTNDICRAPADRKSVV